MAATTLSHNGNNKIHEGKNLHHGIKLKSSVLETDQVRGQMKQFWSQYDPTPTSMMLCSAANDTLAEEDRAQVLQICPNLCGQRVLELGAGIGYVTD